MSTSQAHKKCFAALAVALVLALSGCGSNAAEPSQAGGAGDLSGALSPTERAAETPPVRPGDDEPTPAPESTDFAPVDIDLTDGSFAKGTPKTIHVPSDFIVIVTARADSNGPYRLSVLSPSVAQTFKVPAGGGKKITLDSMREGQSAKLMIGKSTVRVAADAEPGP